MKLNLSRYVRLTTRGKVSVQSSDLKVGDLVYVEKGRRVPADMILLRTTEQSGACFLRTDQLDGETGKIIILTFKCNCFLLAD